MGYNFEIFFSYKRSVGSNAWHIGLKESLVHWVSEELDGEDVRVFFDLEDINVGSRWKTKIIDALCSSKCLVAIWSTDYFRSRYCVAEWLTFVMRSKLTNSDLIAPASWHDGNRFPVDARALQIAKFNDYALVLLCHKNPSPIRLALCTDGDSHSRRRVWVSNPTDAAANHASPSMSRA